jgi:DMSO/TMAO reductase YedYZ heme-binding membrane subunit
MKWGPEHPLAYVMRALLFAAILSAYHAWYLPLDNSPLTTVGFIVIIIMIILTVKKWK